MKKLLFVAFCIISSVVFSLAQTPQTVQPGFTTEREIVGAEKHSYEVNLAKGDFLNFTVEQRGADVVLRVYAPDGKFYDRIDTPNGDAGEEVFKMVASAAGRYRVEVQPYLEFLPKGKYFVKTIEVRKPTSAEAKTAQLKDELMKIVAEDTRPYSFPGGLERLYASRALLTNEYGFNNNAPGLIDLFTKNPNKPPADFSFENELSDAHMEDFGDGVVGLNLRQSYHQKIPSQNVDQNVVQRVGYVFKRTGSEWRIISLQRTLVLPDMFRPFIKLDASRLDGLSGVYDSGKPSEQFTVTRDGDALYGKLPDGDKFMLAPENESVFHTGPMSFAFIRGADGAATQIVMHYPMPDDRTIILRKVK
jgi:hypothetical protein